MAMDQVVKYLLYGVGSILITAFPFPLRWFNFTQEYNLYGFLFIIIIFLHKDWFLL